VVEELLQNPKKRNKMACPFILLANLLLPLLPLSLRYHLSLTLNFNLSEFQFN
jgi:hypothetical protein